MTDVILIAAIVAFFVAAAALVRVLDRTITHSGTDVDLADEASGLDTESESRREPPRVRRAR